MVMSVSTLNNTINSRQQPHQGVVLEYDWQLLPGSFQVPCVLHEGGGGTVPNSLCLIGLELIQRLLIKECECQKAPRLNPAATEL